MPTAADQVGQYVHACGICTAGRAWSTHVASPTPFTYACSDLGLPTTLPPGAICLISCTSAYRVVYFNNTCILRMNRSWSISIVALEYSFHIQYIHIIVHVPPILIKTENRAYTGNTTLHAYCMHQGIRIYTMRVTTTVHTCTVHSYAHTSSNDTTYSSL